jgi:hypothetical protein
MMIVTTDINAATTNLSPAIFLSSQSTDKLLRSFDFHFAQLNVVL